MVKHHLPDALLMAYAAGNLPEAFSLVIAAQASLCDEARVRLEAFDTLGGAVLDQAEPVAMAAGSLEATLALIAAPQAAQIPAPVQHDCAVLPAPVQDYVGGGLDKVVWRSAGMGVKQAILSASDEATVRLLYIPSGVTIPDHTHGGMELTLVLQGAFEDGEDHFARGDVEIADESLKHTPMAVGPEDCICLAATDARLKFSGLLPRLAQPFLQI